MLVTHVKSTRTTFTLYSVCVRRYECIEPPRFVYFCLVLRTWEDPVLELANPRGKHISPNFCRIDYLVATEDAQRVKLMIWNYCRSKDVVRRLW